MRMLLMVALLGAGCDARFVDLRSGDNPTPPPSGGPPADLAGADLQGTTQKPLAEGTFMGRAGHAGGGTAQLVRRGDGAIEVRFGADFTVSGVPGPVVFLTSRADMGNSIDAQADVSLGKLTSLGGAQSYAVPMGMDVGRRNVFVFCQPFRVEVSKAALVDLR